MSNITITITVFNFILNIRIKLFKQNVFIINTIIVFTFLDYERRKEHVLYWFNNDVWLFFLILYIRFKKIKMQHKKTRE